MRRNTRRTRKTVAKKMSPSSLRKFVMKEAAKLSGELEDVSKVQAEEVDADEYAGALEKDLDHLKALKISEAKMLTTLLKIRGRKKSLIKKLSK